MVSTDPWVRGLSRRKTSLGGLSNQIISFLDNKQTITTTFSYGGQPVNLKHMSKKQNKTKQKQKQPGKRAEGGKRMRQDEEEGCRCHEGAEKWRQL